MVLAVLKKQEHVSPSQAYLVHFYTMKFRAVHLLTDPKEPREQRSIAEVSQLIRYGVEYFAVINPKYEGDLPEAREANDRGFDLNEGHYGCWRSHKNAILNYLTNDIDALIICECDCVFTLHIYEVMQKIERAYQACVDHDLLCFTLGPKHGGKTVTDLGDHMVTTTRLIETHCYIIPIGAKDRVIGLFNRPYDAVDYVWTVYGYDQDKHRIGIYNDLIVSVQGDGMSLIDKRLKNSETHFRHLEGQN